MVTYVANADIAHTASRIWEALAAVERWPGWLPTVSAIEALDGLPLRSGRRFRITQPKLRPTVWIVSQLDPNTRFEWRAKTIGLELFADHVLEPMASAGTRIHLRLHAKGWLAGPFAAVFGATATEYLQAEATALKKRVEQLHP